MDETPKSDLPWTVNPHPVVPLKKRKKKRTNPQARVYKLGKEKQKADHMAHMQAEKPFQVRLKRGHNVNGQVYGPGTVTLPGSLARELSAREYVADQEEEKFRGTRAGIIGGRTAQGSHRVRMVPPETFDVHYGQAGPADHISGMGLEDPGSGAKF